MRIALGTAVVAATVAGVAFACSSFESTADNPADAATDASSEAATADAGDSGALDAGDGSSPRGCARYVDAAFCEDFEDGGLGTDVWTTVDVDPAEPGVVTLSSTNDSPISPPHAASIVLGSSHGDCFYAHLQRRITGKFKHFRVRTAVKETPSDFGFLSVGSSSTDGKANFTHIVFVGTGDLDIKVQSQRAVLADGGIDDIGIDGRSLALIFSGKWHDVVLELSDDGEGKNLKLTLDTSIVVTYPLPADFELVDPSFDIGPFCTPAGASGTYEFDDVAAWAD